MKFTLLSLQCFEDLYKAQITEPELWTYLLRCGAIHSKGWEVIAARTLPAVLISGQYEKVSSFLLLVGAFPRLYQNKVLMHNTSHMSYQVQSMNSLLSTVTIIVDCNVCETQETTRGQSLCDRLIQQLQPIM